MRKCLIDFIEIDQDPVEIIKELFNLSGNNPIAVRVSYHLSYKHDIVYYIIDNMDELYYWINGFTQCEDCKNGCQIYEQDKEKYFCITGRNYYDRATDEVHIQFKDFIW